MKHPIILSLMLVSLTAVTAQVSQAENIHLLGAGVNYLQTLGDIKDAEDFDEDSLSFIASYQFQTGKLLKLELDLEMVLDYGGSDEILWQPQGYALIGTWIYAGAGIGWGYLDGTWFNDPFYAIRAGFDLPLGERVHLDINANYRFLDSDVFDEIDSTDADAVMFGAALRFVL